MQLQQNDWECSAQLRAVRTICWAQPCCCPISSPAQLRLLSSTHPAEVHPCFTRLNCISTWSTGRPITSSCTKQILKDIMTPNWPTDLFRFPIHSRHQCMCHLAGSWIYTAMKNISVWAQHTSCSHSLDSFHRVPRSCICSHAAKSQPAQTGWPSGRVSPSVRNLVLSS